MALPTKSGADLSAVLRAMDDRMRDIERRQREQATFGRWRLATDGATGNLVAIFNHGGGITQVVVLAEVPVLPVVPIDAEA